MLRTWRPLAGGRSAAAAATLRLQQQPGAVPAPSGAAAAAAAMAPGGFATGRCSCPSCRSFSTSPSPASAEHFEAVQRQLNEMRGIAGTFGGDHAVYHAVAEAQTGTSLHRLSEGHSGQTDEFKVPELVKHLSNPVTQEAWGEICSLNPLGMDSHRPSISATPANMEVPEIMAKLRRDGTIVNMDGSVRVVKIAVDPVWHIPRLAKAVGVTEESLRERLVLWTQNEHCADPNNTLFLPAIGGTTLYIIGDPAAIIDPEREVACRPHDECNGSDVFGTDICTCRPYLVYAIQDAVETAQRGGVGIIAYYRKEGRALGEVTKFRVYNSRKYQVGGDRPDTYFEQTANIAGIEDARVQQLMPDALKFLGITKIDRLLSMSKDKFEALDDAGIEIVNRVSLPEDWVPANATVEITAKIAAGYNDFQPSVDDSATGSTHDHLWTLDAVRERSHALLELGVNDELPHFREPGVSIFEAVHID
jgi:GTP cyclohydrolase II